MWSLFGNQSDSPYDLYVRQYRYKCFIGGLAAACVLLCAEMVAQAEGGMLERRWITVLLLLCLVLLLYTISVYIRDGLKLRLSPQDDLESLEREKELYYGKWQLRKVYLKSLFSWWIWGKTQKPREFPAYLEGSPVHRRENQVRDVRKSLQRPKIVLRNHPNDLVAAEFLKEMKLDGKMTVWVQRIKQWMFQELIPLILDNHQQNLSLLNGLLEEFASVRGQRWVFGKAEQAGQGGALVASLQDVRKLALELERTQSSLDPSLSDTRRYRPDRLPQFPHDRKELFIDTVRQRSLLERYFNLPSFPNTREYVLSRFQGFRFNGDAVLRQEQRSASDLNRVPTDVHILAHIFFTMLNVGNNKFVDPAFDITREFLFVYPTLPKAISRDQVFFYQISNDWREGPQFDVISGTEHWVAWSGDDNLYYAIALFLLHVREKCGGLFLDFDCREMLHLIS